jgi:hypothetical protein
VRQNMAPVETMSSALVTEVFNQLQLGCAAPPREQVGIGQEKGAVGPKGGCGSVATADHSSHDGP